MRTRTILLATAACLSLPVLTGCGHPGSAAVPAPAVTAAPAKLAPAWNTAPATTPTVAPAQVAPGAYAASPTPIWGFLKLATPKATVAHPATTATPACVPGLSQATNIPVTATAGRTTATVSWQDLGRGDILHYRAGAVAQGWSKGPGNSGTLVQSIPVRWRTVPTRHTCTTLTVTFTGLTSGTAYEFWIDAVHTVTTYAGNSPNQETMIGRSSAIVIR